MENTEQFYKDLIQFYQGAPASDHTIVLMIRNLEECKKREDKLNQRIAQLETEIELYAEQVRYQINFARYDAAHYKREALDLRSQLKEIQFNSERAERIDKINQGLKAECKRYKAERLSLRKQICEEIRELAGDYWSEGIHCPKCAEGINFLFMEADDFNEILDRVESKNL